MENIIVKFLKVVQKQQPDKISKCESVFLWFGKGENVEDVNLTF